MDIPVMHIALDENGASNYEILEIEHLSCINNFPRLCVVYRLF